MHFPFWVLEITIFSTNIHIMSINIVYCLQFFILCFEEEV